MSNTQSSSINPFIDDAVPAGTAGYLADLLDFLACCDDDLHPGLRLVLQAARDAARHLRDALELEADDARVDAEADAQTDAAILQRLKQRLADQKANSTPCS
jgi:hypothetical protein